jgi:hypothetical protein
VFEDGVAQEQDREQRMLEEEREMERERQRRREHMRQHERERHQRERERNRRAQLRRLYRERHPQQPHAPADVPQAVQPAVIPSPIDVHQPRQIRRLPTRTRSAQSRSPNSSRSRLRADASSSNEPGLALPARATAHPGDDFTKTSVRQVHASEFDSETTAGGVDTTDGNLESSNFRSPYSVMLEHVNSGEIPSLYKFEINEMRRRGIVDSGDLDESEDPEKIFARVQDVEMAEHARKWGPQWTGKDAERPLPSIPIAWTECFGEAQEQAERWRERRRELYKQLNIEAEKEGKPQILIPWELADEDHPIHAFNFNTGTAPASPVELEDGRESPSFSFVPSDGTVASQWFTNNRAATPPPLPFPISDTRHRSETGSSAKPMSEFARKYSVPHSPPPFMPQPQRIPESAAFAPELPPSVPTYPSSSNWRPDRHFTFDQANQTSPHSTPAPDSATVRAMPNSSSTAQPSPIRAEFPITSNTTTSSSAPPTPSASRSMNVPMPRRPPMVSSALPTPTEVARASGGTPLASPSLAIYQPPEEALSYFENAMSTQGDLQQRNDDVSASEMLGEIGSDQAIDESGEQDASMARRRDRDLEVEHARYFRGPEEAHDEDAATDDDDDELQDVEGIDVLAERLDPENVEIEVIEEGEPNPDDEIDDELVPDIEVDAEADADVDADMEVEVEPVAEVVAEVRNGVDREAGLGRDAQGDNAGMGMQLADDLEIGMEDDMEGALEGEHCCVKDFITDTQLMKRYSNRNARAVVCHCAECEL